MRFSGWQQWNVPVWVTRPGTQSSYTVVLSVRVTVQSDELEGGSVCGSVVFGEVAAYLETLRGKYPAEVWGMERAPTLAQIAARIAYQFKGLHSVEVADISCVEGHSFSWHSM